MIDRYAWTTPNGHKPLTMLRKTGLQHRLVPGNLSKVEPFAPDFASAEPPGRAAGTPAKRSA